MEQPAPPPSSFFFQYCGALSNRIHHCRPHTYKLCPDHIQAGPTDLSGATVQWASWSKGASVWIKRRPKPSPDSGRKPL